jgi:hypothetical protein
MENAECTLPVGYRILYEHSHLFKYDFKMKTYRLETEYWFDPSCQTGVPKRVVESADEFLDKVVIFVSTKRFPDDFIILISTLRDQLSDGILDNFDKLEILLEQKFGNNARELIEESQSIREALREGAAPTDKEVVFQTNSEESETEEEKD